MDKWSWASGEQALASSPSTVLPARADFKQKPWSWPRIILKASVWITWNNLVNSCQDHAEELWPGDCPSLGKFVPFSSCSLEHGTCHHESSWCGNVGGGCLSEIEILRGKGCLLSSACGSRLGVIHRETQLIPSWPISYLQSVLSIWESCSFSSLVFLVKSGHFTTAVSDSPVCWEILSVSHSFLWSTYFSWAFHADGLWIWSLSGLRNSWRSVPFGVWAVGSGGLFSFAFHP